MIDAENIAVTGTATLLANAGVDANTPSTVVIGPPDGAMFIGGAAVTTGEGFPLTASSPPIVLVLYPGDVLYGRTSGATVNCPTLRTARPVAGG